jgi:TRAP-type uncharacterized transport system substrate-binding protein
MIQRISFAASGKGSHWWEGAVVLKKAMARLEYDLEVNTTTSNAKNVLSVASGESLLGITTPQFVDWAQRGLDVYAGKQIPELRVVAALNFPLWLVAAVDRSAGITSLAELGAAKFPWKVVWPGNDNIVGVYCERIMREHGFTIADVVSWGGAEMVPRGPRPSREADPDNNILARSNTAKYARSGEANGFFLYINAASQGARDMTVLRDLRFLRFDEAIIDRINAEWGATKMTLPANIFPGADEDMPVAGWRHHYIYGKIDVPDEIVNAVLASLEDERALDNAAAISFSGFRPELVPGVKLHRAAAAYYANRPFSVSS